MYRYGKISFYSTNFSQFKINSIPVLLLDVVDNKLTESPGGRKGGVEKRPFIAFD